MNFVLILIAPVIQQLLGGSWPAPAAQPCCPEQSQQSTGWSIPVRWHPKTEVGCSSDCHSSMAQRSFVPTADEPLPISRSPLYRKCRSPTHRVASLERVRGDGAQSCWRKVKSFSLMKGTTRVDLAHPRTWTHGMSWTPPVWKELREVGRKPPTRTKMPTHSLAVLLSSGAEDRGAGWPLKWQDLQSLGTSPGSGLHLPWSSKAGPPGRWTACVGETVRCQTSHWLL